MYNSERNKNSVDAESPKVQQQNRQQCPIVLQQHIKLITLLSLCNIEQK